ncbi:ROK family protein [Halostella litorea]|uniref:ROK family protein n=1 Tax=Halostella litorea TaxID=2528831 RepID=UPI001091C826|nr:ROK family protein [Halostella litorea]
MVRVAAVDVGGTWVRGAYADESGLRGEPWRSPTADVGSPAALADLLAAEFDGPVDAVGVAVAGILGDDRTTVDAASNWDGDGWDLRPIAERLDAPLAAENDGDASALGLLARGDVGADENAAYLTISTGIGLGVLHRGRLIRGAEGGFVNLGWDGDVVHDGVRNPWEGYAAGDRIPERIAEWLDGEDRETILTGDGDAEAFFAAVDDGDPVARDYYARLKRINAAGIGTVTDLFALDVVVAGGGVAANQSELLAYDDDPRLADPVALDDYCVTGAPRVETASPDANLELRGAAEAAREAVREENRASEE